MVLPNATKTLSGTQTITQTDVGTTATTAGTIPIRDGSGYLPGHATSDLAANAVSCSSANTINATNGQITSCSATSYLSNAFFTSYTNIASSDYSVNTAGACQTVASVSVSVTGTASLALVFGSISFGTTDPSLGCAMLIQDDTTATIMAWSRTMGIAYGLDSGGNMSTAGNWVFSGTGTHSVVLQICNHLAVTHNCTVNASSNDWHNAVLTVQMWGH